VVNLTLRPLFPGKELPMSTEQEARWAPDPAWTFWRPEKSLVLAGTRTLNSPVVASRYIDSRLKFSLIFSVPPEQYIYVDMTGFFPILSNLPFTNILELMLRGLEL